MTLKNLQKIPHTKMIACKTRYTLGMLLFRIGVFALLLLPSLALGAGFARESLFLSKSPVLEGDSILVHAVELVFTAQKGSEAKQKIGSAAVSIAPQGAQAVSVSWKPLAGEYTVVAALTDKSGTVVEENSARFTINPKPIPASGSGDTNTPVESSAEVQATIAKFSPTIADFSKPAFLAIDSLRVGAGNWLDQGIAWSKSKKEAAPKGEVLGQATNIGAGGAEIALLGVKWLVANAGVFYPVVAAGFLLGLWRLFARIRRPSN
jgi:hypothetical protein